MASVASTTETQRHLSEVVGRRIIYVGSSIRLVGEWFTDNPWTCVHKAQEIVELGIQVSLPSQHTH